MAPAWRETPSPFLVLVPGSETNTNCARANKRPLIGGRSHRLSASAQSPNSRIVRSGKIWTAAGVSAGLDLSLALVGEIAGQETAEIAQLMIEYEPHPPFDSGHPSKASEQVREKAASELARLAKNPRDLMSVPTILWRRAIAPSGRG
ncbi:MAG TPA: hypothetical protein VGJ01_14375 [Pseudolabrys sp.]|jgi:hypothetical protein